MKPVNLKTKIFLDGGDPKETVEVINMLGFLDGQTTNPSLIAKNPDVSNRLEKTKFTKDELLNLYKEVVSKMSSIVPQGSISIQVYSDKNTKASEMLQQAKTMNRWIPNAHIKFPITEEGLKAAEESVKLGIRVNMTLMFTQEQVAAVYCATIGAKKGQVIISPFIGRLDDLGTNGMGLIKNIIDMFKKGDGHIEILAASIRNMDHLLYSFKLGVDIVTLPFKTIKEWSDKGFIMPEDNFIYPAGSLEDIPFKELDLSKNWRDFNISHELTDKGLEKFAIDWNNLVI